MGEWGWKDARLAEANFPLEETVCKIIIYGFLCENDDLPPPCRELGNGTAPGRPACRHCTFPAAGLLGGEAEPVNTQAGGRASRTRLQHLPQAGTATLGVWHCMLRNIFQQWREKNINSKIIYSIYMYLIIYLHIHRHILRALGPLCAQIT